MTPEMAERIALYLESHPAQCQRRLTDGPGEFAPSCCLGHMVKMLDRPLTRRGAPSFSATGEWCDGVYGNVLSPETAEIIGISRNGSFHRQGGRDIQIDISDLLLWPLPSGGTAFWSLAEMNDAGVPHAIIAKVVRRYYMFLGLLI
jgi:hypothetical protein